MGKKSSSEVSHGVKVTWVIEFVNNKKDTTIKPTPTIKYYSPLYPKVSESNEFMSVSEDGRGCYEGEPSEAAAEMEKLCNSLEKSYNRTVETRKELEDHSSNIKEQIEGLNKIVKEFNKILRKFQRNKEAEE